MAVYRPTCSKCHVRPSADNGNPEAQALCAKCTREQGQNREALAREQALKRTQKQTENQAELAHEKEKLRQYIRKAELEERAPVPYCTSCLGTRWLRKDSRTGVLMCLPCWDKHWKRSSGGSGKCLASSYGYKVTNAKDPNAVY